jgi:hypothetical protein
MISDFSEESGYFRFDNFLSNELGFQAVIPELRQRTHPGGVYIGVGPEQNFTYMVALEPSIAFILDIRRQNMLEHLMYKALFELSADRADFISRLFSRKRPPDLKTDATVHELFITFGSLERDSELYEKNLQSIKDVLVMKHHFGLSKKDLETIGYVYHNFFDAGPYIDFSFGSYIVTPPMPTYAELMLTTDSQGRNSSYLASEENFQYVKTMSIRNLIIPLVGDFAGRKTVRKIGKYLADHDATVTVFYTSNVEEYLFRSSDWRRFYASVAALPMDSASTFIRTVNAQGPSRWSYQFISLLSPMAELIRSFEEGGIQTYHDVVVMSRSD